HPAARVHTRCPAACEQLMGRPKRRARLAWGQSDATPEQLEAAVRFVSEHVRFQVSPQPADEEAAEMSLREAYIAAGVDPPGHIHGLAGPLELVALLAAPRNIGWLDVADEYRERVPHCAWDDAALDRDEIGLLDHRTGESIDYRIRMVQTLAMRHVDAAFGVTGRDGVSR